jgi:hypothetical protein
MQAKQNIYSCLMTRILDKITTWTGTTSFENAENFGYMGKMLNTSKLHT